MPLSLRLETGGWSVVLVSHKAGRGANAVRAFAWTADDGSAQGPRNIALPADPVAAAREILNKVSIDKKEIDLKGYETSADEVHITNDMPGPIHVTVNSPGTTGLKIKLDKSDIPPGEKGTILFSYSVEDAKAVCHDCFKPVKPAIMADVRIEPTAQQFAIKVNFAIPPELLKQLPPELQKKALGKKADQ